MEVRDPVHGSIHILDCEKKIIKNKFFQRLRNIKQLGFSEYIFPGATHTRFLHSIGVMHIGGLAFDKLFEQHLHDKRFLKLKQTFKMGCLLHDIGHAPLSHATESVMPPLKELKLPEYYQKSKLNFNRQANHEDYTIKIITDSSLTMDFDLLTAKFAVDPFCVADLILGEALQPEYFIIDDINYFPLLHQLISSEMDCDRMDYLLRDSYYCGVSYGSYDLDWLIDNFEICLSDDKQAYLGISERAVVTFDDFLLSRFHMFLMVYFHYRSVCLEKLIRKYFDSSDEYSIPADIDAYCEHDDNFLIKYLKKSSSPYAKAIIQNEIPRKIFESFNNEQYETLLELEKVLQENNIEYIKSGSTGRLSKYYGHQQEIFNDSIKVIRTQGRKKSFVDINQATDLFEKFSKSHKVFRLYCDLEQLPKDVKNRISDTLEQDG